VNARAAFALAASTALFAVLSGALLTTAPPSVPAPGSPPWIGETLWSARALDLLVQAFIVLAGVLAIVLLLRDEPGGATHG